MGDFIILALRTKIRNVEIARRILRLFQVFWFWQGVQLELVRCSFCDSVHSVWVFLVGTVSSSYGKDVATQKDEYRKTKHGVHGLYGFPAEVEDKEK